MTDKLRTLLFSTLYPSSTRPMHGIFVETRLRELLKTGQVETRVVAPVPWFPFSHPRFGDYARMAATPLYEERNGIAVYHPRYALPPKIGQNIAPFTLAAGALPTIRRLMRDGFDFDLIDAHFYYPDGVAAAIIASKLGKPFVCTARGSDITLYRQFPFPRHLLQRTVKKAEANLAVCEELAEQLRDLEAPLENTHALRNGVDLQRFVPMDRCQARQQVGIAHEGLLLISVGHLIERKGHHLVIDMLGDLPNAHLVIVGSGEMESALRSQVVRLGLTGCVHFVGQKPNDELHRWFSAADVTVLASSREGWANVLLESMASGTPVVATEVNGTPEVVAAPQAGRLAKERNVPNLSAALADLLANYPDRSEVRRYAEAFSWEETSRRQVELFTAIRNQRR